jgi:hypothetical protein
MDLRTPAFTQAAANAAEVCWAPSAWTIAPVRLPPGPLGRRQGIDDQLDPQLVGERPAGQTPRGDVDDRSQVLERPVRERKTRDAADVVRVHRLGGELASAQVGSPRRGRARDSGAVWRWPGRTAPGGRRIE